MASSGQTTISTPASTPRRYAAMIFASLPAKSPTVVLIWARAIFMRTAPIARSTSSKKCLRQ